MTVSSFQFQVVTSTQPGALGIIQLYGCVESPLHQLTGRDTWLAGQCYLCRFADVDQGLATLGRHDDDPRGGWVQLMPHGGPRIMNLLVERLTQLGGELQAKVPARLIYPQASSDLQAMVMLAMSHAASPAALGVLLEQIECWRAWAERGGELHQLLLQDDPRRHLLHPPTIVVIGQPNVGKSTLSNRMVGRDASIVSQIAGTTRDWVGGLACIPMPQLGDLASAQNWNQLVVRWLDTPGIRDSSDELEQQAISIARQVIEQADVLVALGDPQTDWPALEGLLRRPDLWVMNKVDQQPPSTAHDSSDPCSATSPLPISAQTGQGIDQLQHHILRQLQLDCMPVQPWLFNDELRGACSAGSSDLRRLLGF